MAFTKLAPTTFFTGAKDELITTDVYKTTTTQPINNISAFTAAADPGSFLGIQGGKAMLKQALNLVGSGLAISRTLSSGNILTRIAGVSAIAGGTLRDLSTGPAAGLVSGVTSAMSGAFPIVATVGGYASKLAAASYGDARAMGGLIADLGGATGVNLGSGALGITDPGGVIGTLAGTINQASRLGILGSFGPITQYANIAAMATREGQISLTQIAARTLPTITRQSDLPSFAAMAGSLAQNTLRNLNPNAVSDFSRYYRTPAYSTTANRQSQYGDLITAYNAADTSWNARTRVSASGSSSIYDLTNLSCGSSDLMRTIQLGAMKSTDPVAKLQLFATQFPKSDVATRLSTDFPQTVFGGNSTISNLSNKLANTLGASLRQDSAVTKSVATSPNFQAQLQEARLKALESGQAVAFKVPAGTTQEELGFPITATTTFTPRTDAEQSAAYQKFLAGGSDWRVMPITTDTGARGLPSEQTVDVPSRFVSPRSNADYESTNTSRGF